MSSNATYVSLFVAAAMNLSVFTPPTPPQWEQSSLASRFPASCGRVGQELARGKSDVACAIEATKGDHAARTDIRVKKEGDGDQANYIVDFSTEANCNPCKIRGLQTSDQIIIGAGDLANIQQQIQTKISSMESEAFDNLNEEISKKTAMENCRIDKKGNRLDAEEKLNCRMAKMESFDDEEEATKYFNKHLKATLEEQALSSDPEVREAALAKLAEIKEMDISAGLNQKIAMMTMASTEMTNIEAVKQKALLQTQIASQLPEGQQKQQMLLGAQQMLDQKKTQLQNAKIQMLMSQSNGGSASAIADMNNYFLKAETSLSEVYNASPELQKAKNDTLINGTVNRNNNAAGARGGSYVDRLTVIPQLANPTGLPPAGVIPMDGSGMNNSMGVSRGTMNSRIPANPQFMQAQPVQNYNPTFPLGNQFQQAPQVMMPMM